MKFMITAFTEPFRILYWVLTEFLNLLLDGGKTIGMYWGLGNKKRGIHGDAKFQSWKDLKKTNHAKPDGWYVGLVDGRRVFTDNEACAIGVAPRRTGKSNMGKAQILAQAVRKVKPDLVVFDPHGDLRPATLSRLRAEGYKDYFLNFEDPLKSDHHNPISFVRTNPFHQAKDCDQVMKLVMTPDKKSDHEHFTDFPRLVMAGLIAYQQRKNLPEAKIHKVVDLMIADEKSRAAVFDDMVKNGGVVERAAVTAFRNAGDKERGSFGTTMARKLGIWLRPGFVHITGQDGFTWHDVFLDPQPVVVFITTGGSDIEGAAARLILGNAINTRLQLWPDVVANHSGAGQPRFPKELKVLVDETRLLGNCAAIVTAITETGKMGVSLMMWVLGLRDIFDIYPEASVVVNSCNALIFGGGMEMSTYEDFSRRIGDYTIDNPGHSQSEHGESQSASAQARRRQKADELANMPNTKLVAIMGNVSVQPDKPFRIVGKGDNARLEFL
ncbi:type IV secretory system conjugative DNA transfer family protein [Mesorhizobium sp. B2-3-10]|uniref:type IV secretory system conjugative DNA transfer family protein n=1 Tax=Mesorhizobium sp. B2-3-10 TaxID=2589954 RepID=UPI0015E34125|nr:type IV secretory system conjugative DNA transfer family protein [Mesorhizobium sp. B2-3-10]